MKKNVCSLLIVAICGCILAIAAPCAQAESREEGPAIIDRKGPNALMFEGHGFTNFADRYMLVTNLTRFYDENGEPTTLTAFKIPCEATIQYRRQAKGGPPEAISVTVAHYFDDRPTDTQMNLATKKPEPPQ